MTTEQRFNAVETDLEIVKQLLISTARYAESANRGLDELTVKVDRLAESEARGQARLNELTESEARGQARLDEFIFQAQRLFTQYAERVERLEGQTERLEAIAQMLLRNSEATQSQLQEFQQTTTATLERMDRILDYLLKQSGGSGTVN